MTNKHDDADPSEGSRGIELRETRPPSPTTMSPHHDRNMHNPAPFTGNDFGVPPIAGQAIHRDKERMDEETNDLYGIPKIGKAGGCFNKCIMAWPRTFAIVAGIVIPLWVLIGISCLSGFGLAKLEGPEEITSNDIHLASKYQLAQYTELIQKLSIDMPAICFELYVDGLLDLPDDQLAEEIRLRFFDDLQVDRGEAPMYVVDPATLSGDDPTNRTALYEQLQHCGTAAAALSKNLTQNVVDSADHLSGGMSFSWIRCTPASTGLGGGYHRVDVDHLKPAKQEQRYTEAWDNTRQELFTLYFQDNLNAGLPVDKARPDAVERSVVDASGGDVCEFNFYAAAWFWFTIMTTMGYGNQSPATPEGRAMVYTLGFFSILAFGGVLAMSGYVSSAILDDAMSRCRCKQLNSPWVHCAIWGTCYYSWMLVIASYSQMWKKDRMDIDHTFGDMYWFSYVSTTTIGLGDMYLNPEVIVVDDLITFPLLMLIGFTFVSAFLGKLSEIVIHLFGNKKTGVSNVVDQTLQKRNSVVGVGEESKGELELNEHGNGDPPEHDFHIGPWRSS